MSAAAGRPASFMEAATREALTRLIAERDGTTHPGWQRYLGRQIAELERILRENAA